MQRPQLSEEAKERRSSCKFWCGFFMCLGFLIWMCLPHPYNPLGHEIEPEPYIVVRTDGETNEALHACVCNQTVLENQVECIKSKKTDTRNHGDLICIYVWSDDELVEEDIQQLRFVVHEKSWIYKKGNSYSPIANGVADQSTEIVSFENNSVMMTVFLNQSWFPNEFYVGKIVVTTNGDADTGTRSLRGNSTALFEPNKIDNKHNKSGITTEVFVPLLVGALIVLGLGCETMIRFHRDRSQQTSIKRQRREQQLQQEAERAKQQSNIEEVNNVDTENMETIDV